MRLTSMPSLPPFLPTPLPTPLPAVVIAPVGPLALSFNQELAPLLVLAKSPTATAPHAPACKGHCRNTRTRLPTPSQHRSLQFVYGLPTHPTVPPVPHVPLLPTLPRHSSPPLLPFTTLHSAASAPHAGVYNGSHRAHLPTDAAHLSVPPRDPMTRAIVPPPAPHTSPATPLASHSGSLLPTLPSHTPLPSDATTTGRHGANFHLNTAPLLDPPPPPMTRATVRPANPYKKHPPTPRVFPVPPSNPYRKNPPPFHRPHSSSCPTSCSTCPPAHP